MSDFYIQDTNGNNHKLSVEEFSKKMKVKDEEGLKGFLKEFHDDLLYNVKEDGELHTIFMYRTDNNDLFNTFLLFFVYYADKLTDVLCQKKLNVKYVRAYLHPQMNDFFLFNIYHEGTKVIIKGFALCDNPSKEEIYVSTVCGTGGTAKIFQYLIDVMLNNEYKEPLSYIHLDSVESPNTISFYSKLGFRKTDKDTKNIINDMFLSKAKTFDDYVKEGKSIVGGSMYLFAPDTRGERQLKKKKCHYVYTPKEWFDEIKKGKTNKKEFLKSLRTEKLEGSGLGSFFRGIFNKVVDPFLSLNPAYQVTKKIVNKIDTIKQVINPHLEKYTNKTSKILNEFGNLPVFKLTIVRSPVKQIVMSLVNLITLNKFDELKKQYNFDRMFHLGVIATVKKDGTPYHILIEKNERIELSINKQFPPEAEFMDNPMGNKEGQITIFQMLNNAQGCMGTEKFFDYDAFENNCQVFVVKVLECSGMLDSINKKFILQDVAEIAKQLPEGNKNLMKAFTTIGAVVSRLRGAGKRKRKMKGGNIDEEKQEENDDDQPGFLGLTKGQWKQVYAPYENDSRVLQARETLKSKGFTQDVNAVNALVRQHPKAKGLGWGVGQQPGENKWFKYTPGQNYYEWHFDPTHKFFDIDHPELVPSWNTRTGERGLAGELRDKAEAEALRRRDENPMNKFLSGLASFTSTGLSLMGQSTLSNVLDTFNPFNSPPRVNLPQPGPWKFEPGKQDFNVYLPTKRWVSGGGALLNQDGSVYLMKQGRTNFTSGYYPDVDIFASYGEVGPEKTQKLKGREIKYREKKWIYRLKDGKEVDLKTLEPKLKLTEAESMKKQEAGEYRKNFTPSMGYSQEQADELNKRGSGKPNLELQAVIVKKPLTREEALKHAKEFTKGKFVRETGTSFRVRNIPKQRFEKGSFVTKKISPTISLVLGKTK